MCGGCRVDEREELVSKGISRERQIRRWLEERDFWVCRAAGSLGDADLVALKAPMLGVSRRILLIECKATAAGPYAHFGPKDRADLSFAAKLAGAEAWLCWHPPRGKMVWVPESSWPDVKEAVAA